MVKIQIDDAKLKRQFRDYTEKLNKEASESVVEMARLGATQLAYRIEPYGINGKSKNILERAIYKDINKAYSSVGKTYNDLKKVNPKMANAYGAAIHEGDEAKAQKILERVLPAYAGVKAGDSGTHLKSLRNAQGRVATLRPLNLTSKADLERLKATEALTAGTAKAGFLQAGESLGSKSRIQKWLKKASGLGSSSIVKRGFQTVVTLFNKVRYASNVISESKQQAAINNAYKNHLKRMEKQIEALSKKV